MKFTSECLEINPKELIFWGDVERMRLSGRDLDIVLKNGKVVELKNLRPSTIDLAFRTYHAFLRIHRDSLS